MDQPHNKPNIRHIVISGGGETGFTFYGILRETQLQGLWDYENIVSVHGTSIGAMISLSVLFCKKLGWDSINDYWMLRPWGSIFNFGIENMIDSFEKIGLLDISVIEKTIHPLLLACDLRPETTLQELYDSTGIEFHTYSTNLDKLELVDISHKTHPTWKLTEAVYCSCSLPILFTPYKKDGSTYMDGALMGNYPLLQCIRNGAEPDEIFGIQKIEHLVPPQEIHQELQFGNITDYLFTILAKLLGKVSLECPLIKYQINVFSEFTSLYNIYKVTHEFETRKNTIERGFILAKEYMEKLRESWIPQESTDSYQNEIREKTT
jgi:predicted acylesterase/phospholipase RssA